MVFLSGLFIPLWFFVINPLVPSESYTIFSYEITGNYGENPFYENNSWFFTPLYITSFYYHNKTDHSNGYEFNIILKENKCVITQSFSFEANLTVYYMNVTVISNQTAVYFEEAFSSNKIAFDYQHFTIDMVVKIFIETIKIPEPEQPEGEIRA